MIRFKRFFCYFFVLVISFFSFFSFFSSSCYALSTLHSAQGYWQTIDDHSHHVTSIVSIYSSKGFLKGRIVKIYQVDGHLASDRCVKCKGSQHNKPMLGLVIMRDMKWQGDQYSGGRILDPNKGKSYHLNMHLVDGNTLKLRGYIGFPLIGRTQTWLRYTPTLAEKKLWQSTFHS